MSRSFAGWWGAKPSSNSGKRRCELGDLGVWIWLGLAEGSSSCASHRSNQQECLGGFRAEGEGLLVVQGFGQRCLVCSRAWMVLSGWHGQGSSWPLTKSKGWVWVALVFSLVWKASRVKGKGQASTQVWALTCPLSPFPSKLTSPSLPL